jgi:hypothetical protein
LLLILWENKRKRIRLDVPDKLYSKLVRKARQRGITADNLIVRSVQTLIDNEKKSGRRKAPVIDSEKPGSLHLDNAKIFELIHFL